MYDWPGKPFSETAYVYHAIGVNLTEMRCQSFNSRKLP